MISRPPFRLSLPRHWLRWAGVAVVVLAGIGYLIFSATGSSAEYYETIAEMRAHPSSQDVRVLGTVQPGIQRSDGGLHVRFMDSDGHDTMPVDYTGTVPDIFKPGTQVVVEGKVGSDGVFHASTLQAKCPSKFSSSQTA
ncbi:MAG: cytochrome c maturation protein CcmE [Candidatus Dormibacteraeota bacterium]|nr:cytochrome c maturation protein CcmE [Candidatus Dormibacteraeota bacterium]